MCERLRDLRPGDPGGYRLVARTSNNLGLLYEGLDRETESEQAYLQGLAVWGKLTTDYPGEAQYARGLVTISCNLAGLYLHQGQLQEAAAVCRRAQPLVQDLAKGFPNDHYCQVAVALATQYSTLTQMAAAQSGFAESAPAKLDEAAAGFAYAVAVIRELARANASVDEFQRLLANFLWIAGNLDRCRGRAPEAEAAYREALDVADKLALLESPGVPLRVTPIPPRFVLAGLLSDTGRYREALDMLEQASGALDKLPYRVVLHPVYGPLLRPICVCRAVTLCGLGRYDEAIAEWPRTMPDQGGRFQHLWEYCRALTQALKAGDQEVRVNRDLAALATAEAEIYLKTDALIGRTAYWLAEVYSICATLTSTDERLSAAEREQRVERSAARGVDLLAKAQALGYFRLPEHIRKLEENPNLAILKPRQDFQKLLAQVQRAAPAAEE